MDYQKLYCYLVGQIDDTLGMDPEDLERKITPYTKAVIVTHMQGVPGGKMRAKYCPNALAISLCKHTNTDFPAVASPIAWAIFRTSSYPGQSIPGIASTTYSESRP